MPQADADPADGLHEEPTRTPGHKQPKVVPLARGASVGRYVVIDILGSGGMGIVYRAYDPELDRRIALKLVLDVTGDPQRLLREAQALARVTHPNVIAVYDVGTHGGAVFVAMELVEGRTLQGWRRGAKPDRRQILDVFLAAGRGLAAAHQAGVVHRDFKPSNVMVGDDGRVRVLDFGLARAADLSLKSGELTPGGTFHRGSAPFELPPELDALAEPMTLEAGPASLSDAADLELPEPSATMATPSRSLLTPSAREAAIAAALAAPAAPSLTEPSQPVTARHRMVPVPRPAALRLPSDDESTLPHDPSELPKMMASRVMGTPSYMAPEQRKAGIYDARVDQFSFAVALYEALYDERPFAGTSPEEVAIAALSGDIRPPPRGSDVPPWLRKVIMRALSALPADRYPTMEALLAALEADPAKRRRRLVLAAVGLGLVGLAVFGLVRRSDGAGPCHDAGRDPGWSGEFATAIEAALAATGRPHAADVQRQVASLLGARATAWSHMRREACEATRVRGEQSAQLLDLRMACLDRRRAELTALARELARTPAPIDRAVDAALSLPGLDTCADREALLAAAPLPADPAARARVAEIRRGLADAMAMDLAGRYHEAHRRADLVLAEAERSGHAPVIAEALYTAGSIAAGDDDSRAAEDALYRATARAADSRDDALAARAWIDLVYVVGAGEARPAEGMVLARAAEAAVARAGNPPLLRATLRHHEAMVLQYKGDLDAAIDHEREALTIREQALGKDGLEVSHSVNHLAGLLAERGDYPAAEALHRRALDMRRAALGPSHPLVADSLNNLGAVIYHQGRLDEAERLYQQALALRIAALGEHHRDVGTSYNNLGGLAMDRGDWDAAERYLDRALAVWEASLGADHADLAIPLGNLGDLAVQRGDFARALPLCTRALAIESRAGGDDNPNLAWSLTCQGEAMLGLRSARDAVTVLERARRLREGSPGDAGELARTRFALARALADSGGDRARAHELARTARDTFSSLGGTWRPRVAAVDAWLARH